MEIIVFRQAQGIAQALIIRRIPNNLIISFIDISISTHIHDRHRINGFISVVLIVVSENSVVRVKRPESQGVAILKAEIHIKGKAVTLQFPTRIAYTVLIWQPFVVAKIPA